MNSVDYIILAIIAIIVITSYYRGFIKTLFDTISMLVTYGLTYYLYPYVSKFVRMETNLYRDLTEYINDKFDFDKILQGVVTKEGELKAIKDLPLPESIKDIITANNNLEMFELLDVSSFAEYISGSLASIVVNVIVFVALFLIIWIALSILINALNLVAMLPGLKEVNKLAGAGVGLLQGIIFIFIGFAVVSLVISVNNSIELVTLIEESTVGSFLYNNNPIMDLLNNNVKNNYFWNIIAK